MRNANRLPPQVRKNGPSSTEFIQTTLRIPPLMYAQLKKEAVASGRSLHGEILHRIASTLGAEFALRTDADAGGALEGMAADIRILRELAQHFMESAS